MREEARHRCRRSRTTNQTKETNMSLLTKLTLCIERALARPLLAILRPLDLEDVEVPTDD